MGTFILLEFDYETWFRGSRWRTLRGTESPYSGQSVGNGGVSEREDSRRIVLELTILERLLHETLRRQKVG